MGRGPSPQKTEATRARLLTAAEAILAEGGYSAFTMKELAERAGCAVGLAYRYFPSREALVVALYGELARRVYGRVGALEGGTVGARFASLVGKKLAALDRRPKVFRALAHAALAPDSPTGVFADDTRAVREAGVAAFTAVVAGAANAPSDPAPLGRILYGLHLLFVLGWTQQRHGRGATTLAALARDLAPLVDVAAASSASPLLSPIVERLDGLTRNLMETTP
ncbi:MAG: TetR/AcrR family transcriptional regulator [Myxococcales bacterium]|nr:TetR/AcrR family transcriptional regulator [Myxococcales bacterium]